jgi:hypothetical protein
VGKIQTVNMEEENIGVKIVEGQESVSIIE